MHYPFVAEVPLGLAPWKQIEPLLTSCYPRPPRDVFQRVLAFSKQRKSLWIAIEGESMIGLVMLSPHSKGGHLENLAVLPSAQGRGIGRKLVHTLLSDISGEGPAMISLTTRIPHYFQAFGFNTCSNLGDRAAAMLVILPFKPVSGSEHL